TSRGQTPGPVRRRRSSYRTDRRPGAGSRSGRSASGDTIRRATRQGQRPTIVARARLLRTSPSFPKLRPPGRVLLRLVRRGELQQPGPVPVDRVKVRSRAARKDDVGTVEGPRRLAADDTEASGAGSVRVHDPDGTVVDERELLAVGRPRRDGPPRRTDQAHGPCPVGI